MLLFASAPPTTSATKPLLVDPDLIHLGGLLVGDGGLLTHGGNDGDEELVKRGKKDGTDSMSTSTFGLTGK